MDHSLHGRTSHDAHAGHHMQDFLRKFWVVLALSVPIILYSDLPRLFLSWDAPAFPGSDYLQLVLGSVVFFYGGSVFIRGAWGELKARLPGMMTLIALAITAAYLYSAISVLIGSGMTLFWELSTLIAVMLIGHWIEMKAVQGAKGALQELSRLLPNEAEVLREGKIVTVALSELREGDVVLVRPGGKVPADGVVVEGSSEFNEALITGESQPVEKGVGESVIAGSTNGDGGVRIRIEKTGERTFLAGVMRLVAEAEASKSRLQLLSDRAAFYLTILAVSAGSITFFAWLFAGQGLGFAVERLVAVLVIACPHALGLAIPLVASISTTMAAQNGFFIKRRLALEAARNVTTVVFDKTGTLTQGVFAVVSFSSPEALSLAAAVELLSEHPVGKAIVQEAKRQDMAVPEAKDFKRLPGTGAQAEVGGRIVFVGHGGGADIRVEADGVLMGTIALADRLRPEAKEAVETLRRLGLDVVMITGDSAEVAAEVAGQLGIRDYLARVRPEDKARKIKDLQERGGRVMMVGDGINDAPALAQADLGVAIGAGTNVAIESAGIILVKNDPRDIAKIIRLSRLTYAKMIQNLFWAAGYNIVALPVAAGALAVYGIMLQPAIAAVFMSLSTVIVAVNASLLKRAAL